MTAGTSKSLAAESQRIRRRVRRGIVPVVGLAMLAISALVNIVLFRQADQSYRELSEVRLDPLGLKRNSFANPAGAPSDPRPVFLFFGDSRAEQWPDPSVSEYRFINHGIGGQTTEQIRGRVDEHMMGCAPKVVLIQAGINDLKAIALFPWRREEIVRTCESNLQFIVQQAAGSGATVIVTTIFPPGDVPLARRQYWSPGVVPAVNQVNDFIRGLGGGDVVVFDAWKELQLDGRLRSGYGIDTLHLSPLGYDVLNQALIRKVLPPIPPAPNTTNSPIK
jgi:lysophospholipase L1-like esterase